MIMMLVIMIIMLPGDDAGDNDNHAPTLSLVLIKASTRPPSLCVAVRVMTMRYCGQFPQPNLRTVGLDTVQDSQYQMGFPRERKNKTVR